MPRVIIVQRRMTEYRVPLFNKLREKLDADKVRLGVVYGTTDPHEALRVDEGALEWGERLPSKTWRFLGQRLYGLPHLGGKLAGTDLVILPHENRFLPIYGATTGRRPFERLAFWGHGDNFVAGGGRRWARRVRVWSTLKADWWFAYTSLSVQRLEAIGFPAGRITCLNNAADTVPLARWRDEITPEDQVTALRMLGLKGGSLGVSLGSLAPEKRLPLLFEATDRLRERVPDFELLIMGDGPLRGEVQALVAERPWARWLGARHGREKVLFASLGRVMLNPGMVGLGILDSFVLGLPMVTTDCGIHSPEIVYLRHGENGLMAAPSAEAFADAACAVLTDPALAERLAHGGAETAKTVTLEAMVQAFAGGIRAALSAAPLYGRGKIAD